MCLFAAMLLVYGCTRSKPAAETDNQRMKDIYTIATIVERYHQKTGHYPYAENWENVEPNMVAIPIGIFISSKKLPKEYDYPPNGLTGAIFKYADFLEYLREVLGRDLTLPEDDRDPFQWVPYQIHFDGKHYFVSAHLTQPNAFTRPVANAHKYQIGSIGNEKAKIRAYSEVKP
jgi:hypothetical protein